MKLGPTIFTPDKLLLLSKAHMKVSCNAKHGTDKNQAIADAVTFVVSKVMKQTNAGMMSAPNFPIMGVPEKSLLESNK